MEPDIKDGSLVFVDKSKKDINEKDIFLVNINGEIFIKRINIKEDDFILKSFNQNYIDLKVENLIVIGKVKGVFYSI